MLGSLLSYCTRLLYNKAPSCSWTQTKNTLSSLHVPASFILPLTHHLHTAATSMAPYVANKKPLVTVALILLAVLTIANCICCTIAARDLPGSGSVAEA